MFFSKKTRFFLLIFGLAIVLTAIQKPSVTTATQEENTKPAPRFMDLTFVISGTSNVRDWDINADVLNGIIQPGALFANLAGSEGFENMPDGEGAWFKEVTLSIPADHLDSGIAVMNQTMHKHLRSEEYPELGYRLVDVESISRDLETGKILVKAKGRASAAGEEHELVHEVWIDLSTPPLIRVSGELDVTFSDFRIEPPTFMRGALTTGNAMKISFGFIYVLD